MAARTKQEIEQTGAEVRQLGRKSLVIPTDVGQTDQVEKMVEAAIARFGKVDIMVANAGIDIAKPLVLAEGVPPSRTFSSARIDSELTEQEWHTVINVNLDGVVRCAKAVGPHMIKQRRGKIINIGSIDGVRGAGNDIAYATAKGAVHRFTQALALQWAPFNINVNAIAPGPFLTEIWRRRPEYHMTHEEIDAALESIPSGVPLGRWGRLRELGLLAVFLASNASSYITGQILVSDGGVSL